MKTRSLTDILVWPISAEWRRSKRRVKGNEPVSRESADSAALIREVQEQCDRLAASLGKLSPRVRGTEKWLTMVVPRPPGQRGDVWVSLPLLRALNAEERAFMLRVALLSGSARDAPVMVALILIGPAVAGILLGATLTNGETVTVTLLSRIFLSVVVSSIPDYFLASSLVRNAFLAAVRESPQFEVDAFLSHLLEISPPDSSVRDWARKMQKVRAAEARVPH